MANEILLREGFDSYNGLAGNVGLATRWTEVNQGARDLVSGRLGGQGLRTGHSGVGQNMLYRPLSAAVDEFAAGFAVRVPSFAGAVQNHSHVAFMSGGNYQVGIRCNLSGAIALVRQDAHNSTAVLDTTSAGVLQAGVWTYCEVECVLSNTVGEFRLFVEGNPTPLLDLSGIDTLDSGTTVNRFNLGASSAIGSSILEVDFDDIYVKQGASRLGPHRVRTLAVSADGATQDWVPSTGATAFGCLDESQASSTDYVSASAVNEVCELEFANLSISPDTISDVNLIAYAAKTDATARALSLGVKLGATVSDSADVFLTTSYARYDRELLLDPDGAAWTLAALNGLLGRPKVTV